MILGLAWACSPSARPSTASSASSRLVGSWQMDLTLDPAFEPRMQRLGGDVAAAKAAANAQPPMITTFRSDGHFTTEGNVLGHPVHDEYRWEVISEAGERVTVRTLSDKPPEEATYTFTSADVVHMETKLPNGNSFEVWLRRVK